MLKIVVLVEKREDLTGEEFVDYWDEEHVDHVAKVETLRRYTIAPALEPDEAPYDGIAELYFESTDDIREGFTDDLERELREESAALRAAESRAVTVRSRETRPSSLAIRRRSSPPNGRRSTGPDDGSRGAESIKLTARRRVTPARRTSRPRRSGPG